MQTNTEYRQINYIVAMVSSGFLNAVTREIKDFPCDQVICHLIQFKGVENSMRRSLIPHEIWPISKPHKW